MIFGLTECWDQAQTGSSLTVRISCSNGELPSRYGRLVLIVLGKTVQYKHLLSALAGKSRSLRRHARMVNEFAQWLLPELTEYIAPLDIRKLSEPKFATFLVGEWVYACRDLQKLEKEISALTEKDLAWRLTLLADNYSTNLVDLNGPIAMWLENSGVSRKLLDTYAEKAEAELACRKRRWQSDTHFKGKP